MQNHNTEAADQRVSSCTHGHLDQLHRQGQHASTDDMWRLSCSSAFRACGLFCGAGLIAMLASCNKSAPISPTSGGATQDVPAALITENNRGVGLMGQFKYTEAREVFEDLHDQHPTNIEVAVNAAIARLNEQGEENVARATTLLDEAIAAAPQNPRANYCRGLLKLYAGEPEQALANFTITSHAAPEDADAAYLRGLCLEQTGDFATAKQQYKRALELNPYYASAVIGLSRVARQAGNMDETRQWITEFERLKLNPYGHVFEFKYMAMGRFGETWPIGKEIERPGRPDGNLFAQVLPVETTGKSNDWQLGENSALSFVDADADHDLDVVISGAAGDTTNIHLLLNDGHQQFTVAANVGPLANSTGVRAVLHGDVDNNSKVDHVLLGDEGARLLLQAVEGSEEPTESTPNWREVTLADVAGRESILGGALFDADHDGDLDVYCVRQTQPDVLINNDRDGSYRALGAEFGLDSGAEQSRQVIVADFDNDRDLDLLVIKRAGDHVLLENDRLWAYRTSTAAPELRASSIDACVAADLNQDGFVDLATLTDSSTSGVLTVWHGGIGWAFTQHATSELPPAVNARPSPALAVRDIDGDGVPEILVSGDQEISIHDAISKRLEKVSTDQTIAAWGLASFDATAGPSMVLLTRDGGLLHAAPGTGRYEFLSVTFAGKHDEGDSLRSNFSGIGTRWQARSGPYATSGVALPQSSGPGQSLQPTQIGLGGKSQIDMLELVWPDGVFQSEVALAPGPSQLVTETQRQLSSCPVLFAWNGQAYGFVTDVIGVAGLGYLVKPGEYGTPRPFERLLISSQRLVPREGRLALKLGEPMEEVCYLDQVSMQVVDVPRGWSVALDERMGLADPQPTSELFFYRDDTARHPAAAANDRGMDVLSAIADADGVAAPVGEIDKRFIGVLRNDHTLTLHFDPPLEATGKGQKTPPVLLIDGWIEYPYSQTNFAAWQAGVEYVAPCVEARSADGEWVPLLDRFGYPAGMPREMSVPLEGLPERTTELRIRTNLEIYWDRIRVAYPEPCPAAQTSSVPLEEALLARVGFAERTDFAQRRPEYDYARRSATWDARHPHGNYTRFGEVDELIAFRDEALAIFGPGEEIHFEFATPDGSSEPGMQRWYVLAAAGWCKDMDLYTRTGGSLEPLPTVDEGVGANPRRDQLHRKYNIRYEAGK